MLTLVPQEKFFDSLFLHESRAMIDTLKKLEPVLQVRSPLALPFIVAGPMGPVTYPSVHVDQPRRYRQDSLRIVRSQMHREAYLDFSVLPVYIRHRHFAATEDSQPFLEQVRKITAHSHVRTVIAGKLPAENAFKNEIKTDFVRYLGLSVLLCVVVLFALYRKVRLFLLPVLVSVLSIIITFGLMGLLGLHINIMSVLLPPLLLFTSTSDSIHLLNAYRSGPESEAIRKVFLPTLLTSLTTAIGFLSLLWIRVIPIREFGISAAIGVTIAFLVTYATLPFLARKFTSIDSSPAKDDTNLALRYCSWLMRNKKIVLTVVLFFILTGMAGIPKLKIDAFLLSDLPKESPARVSFQKMDSIYGGSKPWMLALEKQNDGAVFSTADIQALKDIRRFLTDSIGIVGLRSPYLPFKYAKNVYPKKEKNRLQLVRSLTNNYSDSSYLLSGFVPEWGSALTLLKSKTAVEYIESHYGNLFDARLTGTTYLIDKSHHLLSKNLILGIISAILTVSLLLGFYFKSLKWMFISLLPNAITLAVLGGIIGFLGIPLQLSNSIIFTVAFGVVVDDTIHFIVTYLQSKQSQPAKALEHTFKIAGKSILFTSIIIAVGFSLFLFSSFGATFQLGLFLVLSIILALIMDLVFLPAVIGKKKNQSNLN